MNPSPMGAQFTHLLSCHELDKKIDTTLVSKYEARASRCLAYHTELETALSKSNKIQLPAPLRLID